MAKRVKPTKRGGPGQAFQPAPFGYSSPGAVWPTLTGLPTSTKHQPTTHPTEVPATPFQPAGPLVQRFY